MPIPDLGPRLSALERLRIVREKAFARHIADWLRRGGKRPDGEAGEIVPVEPNRPLDLSGSAAAALDFED